MQHEALVLNAQTRRHEDQIVQLMYGADTSIIVAGAQLFPRYFHGRRLKPNDLIKITIMEGFDNVVHGANYEAPLSIQVATGFKGDQPIYETVYTCTSEDVKLDLQNPMRAFRVKQAMRTQQINAALAKPACLTIAGD